MSVIQPTKRIREIFEQILEEKNIAEDNPNALAYQAVALGMYLDEQWLESYKRCKHDWQLVEEKLNYSQCTKCFTYMEKK